jgi:glutaredoxin/glutathione-dependent peroxiredoxin
MIDHQDATNVDSKGIAFTIRSVFIIDPKKTIRLILSYPASTGRNTAEVLRVLDSLQTGDKNRITTPINWLPGDDVIVHPTIPTEEAQVRPYVPFPARETVANILCRSSTQTFASSSHTSVTAASQRRRLAPMFKSVARISSI